MDNLSLNFSMSGSIFSLNAPPHNFLGSPEAAFVVIVSLPLNSLFVRVSNKEEEEEKEEEDFVLFPAMKPPTTTDGHKGDDDFEDNEEDGRGRGKDDETIVCWCLLLLPASPAPESDGGPSVLP